METAAGTPATKKSSKKVIIIWVAVAVVILGGSTGAYLYFKPKAQTAGGADNLPDSGNSGAPADNPAPTPLTPTQIQANITSGAKLVGIAKSVGVTLIPNADGLIDLGTLSPSDLTKVQAAATKAGNVFAGQGKGGIDGSNSIMFGHPLAIISSKQGNKKPADGYSGADAVLKNHGCGSGTYNSRTGLCSEPIKRNVGLN